MAVPSPASDDAAPPGSVAPVGGRIAKLGVMMFLQLFILGAWFETQFSYIPSLKFPEPWMTPLVYGAFNIGALVALFFSTQLADRRFAAQKFLAFSHLVGGLAILAIPFLQLPMGTQVGNYNSVTISEKGDAETGGQGTMADGTKVTVENLTTADKSASYWDDFAKLDVAKRPVVTFVVTKQTSGESGVVGDAKAPLAPFWPVFLLMLVHSVFFAPTLSISNSIAFAALTDPARQFGPVRLWGTVGWIAASWPFIFILADWAAVTKSGATGFDWLGQVLGTQASGAAAVEGKKYVYLLAGVASLVLAAFSLTLPHTPPKAAAGAGSLAWVKALGLLRNPVVLVLFVVTFIDAAVHQSYFFWTFDFLASPSVGIPQNWAGAAMKLGQIAEVLTMLGLGAVLRRLGWRWTMVIGVLGHAARFAVFAFFPSKAPVLAVILLHGVCYAFFFAAVSIYVDKRFPKDVRSTAQGLFNALVWGVGPFVANFACEQLKAAYKVGDGVDYQAVFTVSMAAALFGAVFLALFFRPKEDAAEVPSTAA